MKNLKSREIMLSIASILAANIDAVMAISNTGSAYNGDVVNDIYNVFLTGNDVLDQGSARIETRVRTTRALPNMTATTDPIGAYEQTPTGTTVDVDYAERTLTVQAGMLYDEFDPDEWRDIWDQFAAQGDTYTNLSMNAELMRAIMMLYQNRVGNQISREFWNGIIAGTDRIDGIVTKALLDAAVVDVPTLGAITPANVIAVFEDMWEAVPPQFFNDPNYNLHCSTAVYKMLQVANQAAAATNSGYLGNTINSLFLGQKIKYYAGMSDNNIVGAKGTTGADSNLVFGFYAIPDAELGAPRVGRVAENSELHFVRMNYKYDAQYREGSEIILYTGV